MKPQLTVSINPSYYCNFRCNFCYLSDEQLGQSLKIDFEKLEQRLAEISKHYEIRHIDLYGGEIGLLKSYDLMSLKRIASSYLNGTFNVISNGSVANSFFLDPDIDLTISWDYKARQDYQKVYDQLSRWKKPIHILSLASEAFCGMSDSDIQDYIQMLNQCEWIQSVEIKPYSLNPFHKQKVSYSDFEMIVKKIIENPTPKNFLFVNEAKIKQSLSQDLNAWSDDHIYITPEADLAVLEFNDKGEEYFQKISSVLEYQQWTLKEKVHVLNNSHCSRCDYLGRCLSEHLKEVKDLEQSCNGFYHLLNWYENERL